MGRMLDGQWITHDLGPDANGRYVRRAAQFRAVISPGGEFPPEAGRYHLFFSYACGWSHRVLLARALKGLEPMISATVCEPFMGEQGWTLNGLGSPVPDATTLWQVYKASQRDYTGRASVPVLWDKQTGGIVTNESMDLLTCLDTAFDQVGANRFRLFPADRDAEVRAMIAANYAPVSNGVYRAGFASSQQAHTEAVTGLFERLDHLEELLSRQRYLLDTDQPTAADVALFPTLFRFDTVYYTHFKCNLRHVYEYPNLWAYTRDMYQTPGVADTCNLEQTKRHYYTSHESIHPRRTIPLGPVLDFDQPHGRA